MAEAIVHCHFYQPPRENPWRDVVDAEASAAPFHDWNARIAHECYDPFATARLLDDAGHIVRRINLYEWVSFDVGTTLARWLERNVPATYEAILAADRTSASRLGGHGNAIAAPYHHVILPLASPRDRATEIRWGIADFRRRFGREPEGFWLPETAVDELTLVALAEAGIRFTILAPHQAENVVTDGKPLRFSAGGGRSIALFIYDGTLAHDAAFGRVLDDGLELARRLAHGEGGLRRAGSPPSEQMHVRSIALDGETFGHHRRFAEMALARAISHLIGDRKACVENFASVLAHHQPVEEAVLVEPSSWSCVHGVERWRSNCSCGMKAEASHAWRRPLRAAFNWLARELDERFVDRAAPFGDAWKLRDSYGTVAAASSDERRSFLASLVGEPDAQDALALFDGVRARLGMFGSCAWFFDDVTGHETELMLRLAVFAIATLAGGDDALENEFLERLALAKGDSATGGDAATIYRQRVLPLRLGARS
jgi:alpha-amylase/alpha-mannosidase (GH57 family)